MSDHDSIIERADRARETAAEVDDARRAERERFERDVRDFLSARPHGRIRGELHEIVEVGNMGMNKTRLAMTANVWWLFNEGSYSWVLDDRGQFWLADSYGGDVGEGSPTIRLTRQTEVGDLTIPEIRDALVRVLAESE